MTDGSALALLFRDASPQEAWKNTTFRKEFADFIARGDTEFQRQVSKLLNRKRPRSSDGAIDEQITAFLRAKAIVGRQEQISQILLKVTTQLRNGCADDLLNDYTKRAEDEDENGNNAEGHDSVPERNRQQYAVMLFERSGRRCATEEGVRRMLILRILYELDYLILQGICTTKVAAEAEFSRLTDWTAAAVRELRETTRAYVALANCEHGLGYLLMLGKGSRALWERDVHVADVPLIISYCQEEFPEIHNVAAKLQPIGKRFIEQSFAGFPDAKIGLYVGGHLLSRHFQSRPVHENSALQALAAVAGLRATNVDDIQQQTNVMESGVLDFVQDTHCNDIQAWSAVPDAVQGRTTFDAQTDFDSWGYAFVVDHCPDVLREFGLTT